MPHSGAGCVRLSEGIDGDWVVNDRCALQCVNCIDSVLNVSSAVRTDAT